MNTPTEPSVTDKYTAEMAHAAVERGAAWLDKKCPTWFREIDLESLDLEDAEYCILGQTAACLTPQSLSKTYWSVLRRFRINGAGLWPSDRGFNLPWLLTVSEDDTAFEMLTIAWREYIRQRLESQP